MDENRIQTNPTRCEMCGASLDSDSLPRCFACQVLFRIRVEEEEMAICEKCGREFPKKEMVETDNGKDSEFFCQECYREEVGIIPR